MFLRPCSLKGHRTLTLFIGVRDYYPIWRVLACLCSLVCFACNPFALPPKTPQNKIETTSEATANQPTSFFSIPLLEGKLNPFLTETPSPTQTATLTLSPTNTPTMTLTPSATYTATFTPTPTATKMPKLNVLFQTCDTGIDIFSGLGEVTNAYITVQNIGNQDAENVRITLAASDEEKPHRDRQYIVPHLPPQYEISVKLTVDTQSRQDTVLTVHVSAENAVSEAVTKENCSSRFADKERIEALGSLFKVLPMAAEH